MSPPTLRPAVFLDKDGTLIPNVPYNVDPAFILLMPGAREALPRLVQAGYALVVVTNQSGVARGLYTLEDQVRVERHIRALLDEIGAPLTAYYFCPHLPGGSVEAYAVDCDCRKPQPGLIRRAAEEHGLDLSHSWFVGDIPKDAEAGRRAGCRTILVDRFGEHLAGARPEAMRKVGEVGEELALEREGAQACLVERRLAGDRFLKGGRVVAHRLEGVGHVGEENRLRPRNRGHLRRGVGDLAEEVA
jgi:histidinol-phosphate phosphatase family protein